MFDTIKFNQPGSHKYRRSDPEILAGNAISIVDESYIIKAPIVIMDDWSFAKYCEEIGVSSSDAGSIIVLNRIWDSANSNFRYKEYIPFLPEG